MSASCDMVFWVELVCAGYEEFTSPEDMSVLYQQTHGVAYLNTPFHRVVTQAQTATSNEFKRSSPFNNASMCSSVTGGRFARLEDSGTIFFTAAAGILIGSGIWNVSQNWVNQRSPAPQLECVFSSREDNETLNASCQIDRGKKKSIEFANDKAKGVFHRPSLSLVRTCGWNGDGMIRHPSFGFLSFRI
jgi:hypothetical protein